MKCDKRIYIAYTGGTIGMTASAEGYRPQPGALAACLSGMAEFHRPEMPAYTMHEYAPLLDSADMSPENWQAIADDIVARYQDFDGFVILHGTDTMAYTASALSFMLQDLGKPVIVTGSQIPLPQLRSDGHDNLLNALYLAAWHPVPEVTLFFHDRLLRGNRATKVHANSFAAFDSPNLAPLARVGINVAIERELLLEPGPGALRAQRISRQAIAIAALYPGINAGVLRNVLSEPVAGLVLKTYGMGNAPRDAELLRVLEDASARGVLIVNCTQCLSGSVDMHGYATGNALAHAGVLSGFDMTTECALAKLHYVLSLECTHEERIELLATPLRGELTPAD